jgi:hypothetical protein
MSEVVQSRWLSRLDERAIRPGLRSRQSGWLHFLRNTRSAAQHITELWHCLGIGIVQDRARGGPGENFGTGVGNKTGALVDIVFCARLSMTGNTFRTGNTA